MAHNNNVVTGDNSYGLLQINMIDETAERRKNSRCRATVTCLSLQLILWLPPQIYDQQGLEAWGSYRNSSYKQFLEDPSKCLPSNGFSDAINSPNI